jgi:UDP-N-acetylglucosamine--N-acetylmuramyl-(pentapeptide) pyrophosphoryl-undecaprenol N-acetylglucosamine transferase
LEFRVLPEQGKQAVFLDTGRLKGVGWWGRVRTLLGLPFAIGKAWRVMGSFRPRVVLGVGGYASVPAMLAAWLRGIPTALHEQNARPGLANRLLGHVADEVLLSFPEASPAFAGVSTLVTGNPVRQAFIDAGQTPLMLSPVLNLLVVGGSQGAKIFAEVVPDAVLALSRQGKQIRVLQQARSEDCDALRAVYQAGNIEARIEPFIEDMVAAYREADLVICRAGATTVAELTAAGRPALLVPYPFAADDHQAANANALVRGGGGWLRRQENLSVAWLTDFLRARFEDPDGLVAMGRSAAGMARLDAARRIVARLAALAGEE